MPSRSSRLRFVAQPIPSWRSEAKGISVAFTGRAPLSERPTRAEVLGRIGGAPLEVAWVQQEHSAGVRPAGPGGCGKADALWTRERGLALAISTADCVPIICGNSQAVSAIHAGWRGLVAGVIESALTEIEVPHSDMEAWIGPAIGVCCYEVGPDVAEAVARSSTPIVVTKSERGAKPHVNLQAAAEAQLRRLGVERIHRVGACTRCDANLLWSYRGTGGSGGRNISFAWLDVQ